MPFNFEKLEVYNKAVDFANDVYNLTKRFLKNELFGITGPLRRAAVSVSLKCFVAYLIVYKLRTTN